MSKFNIYSNVFLAAIATLVIVYFYPHPQANHYKFEEGRPWNYAKLIAPFDIPIRPDSATVLRVRDSLDRKFVPVFERKEGIADSVITALMASWVRIAGEEAPDAGDAAMRKRAVSFLRGAYSRDVVDDRYGERIAEGSLPNVKITNANTVRQYSSSGISYPEKVFTEMIRTMNDSAARPWAEKYKIRELLRPNLVYNAETSGRLYDYDLYRLTAIRGVIQQGQTIIDKGAVITPQDYTNLLTYERMIDEQLTAGGQSKWMVWLGQLAYVALLMCGLMAFMRFSAPDIWNKRMAMLFVISIVVIFFLIATALDYFIDQGIYLVPMAIVPVLMVVFFNATSALFVSATLTMLCAGISSFPLEFIMLQFAASTAAVYSLRQLSRRTELLRTAGFVVAAYWLGYVALEMMLNGSLSGFSWRMMAYLGISAALCSMAYIAMAAVEKLFGFVSVVTLIELSDTNNPVLRELSEQCPGTFQHSMAVSSLASDAAAKIGANEQLVRAGALFHDIGKLDQPNFYTENQHGVNPHDPLPPERSAEIIIGHVKAGLKRADKIGLPAVVKDFISQHHGKGKAKYFYFNYCKAHPGEDVDPAPFTYPGPNPRTREASLLMMADSVEAASRSLKEPTAESIKELVDKIIDGQIADGLHNDSPISFRDVHTIKNAFVKRLMTIYHSRIAYPSAK